MNPAFREVASRQVFCNENANKARDDILHRAGHSANSLWKPPKDGFFLLQYSALGIFLQKCCTVPKKPLLFANVLGCHKKQRKPSFPVLEASPPGLQKDCFFWDSAALPAKN